MSSLKKWGRNKENVEFWDANPIFLHSKISFLDKIKLYFYPKKFFLYNYIRSDFHKNKIEKKYRILDVGCGTGATVIDLKKMLGEKAEVYGLEVIEKQVELAKEKMNNFQVQGEVKYFDGEVFPYPDDYFDAVYSSDVLGHVKNVPKWLKEINRILKPGGILAMFSESELGKHAYIRNYLMKKELNVDPHAEFHISLFSKDELKKLLNESGFQINKLVSVFWASFFVHPDEFYQKLQESKRFPVLRRINWLLFWLKKIFHPVSTAVAEFYGLVEVKLVGEKVEGQGFIILGLKK